MAHVTRECIKSTLDDCLRAWPSDIPSAAKLAITRTALQIYGNPAYPENRTCRHEKELGSWLLAHTEQGRWVLRPQPQVIDQIGQRAIDCLVGIHPLEQPERKTGYLHIIGYLLNNRYHSDAYERMFDQIARALWFDTQPAR